MLDFLFVPCIKYLLHMILGVHFGNDLPDLSFFIYQKRGSVRAVKCSAHKLLLTPNAILLHYLTVFIGYQGKR